MAKLIEHPNSPDYYRLFGLKHYPLVDITEGNMADWLVDAENFLADPTCSDGFVHPWFNDVAQPMYKAWDVRKNGLGTGLDYVREIKADDWKIACEQWILRRVK